VVTSPTISSGREFGPMDAPETAAREGSSNEDLISAPAGTVRTEAENFADAIRRKVFTLAEVLELAAVSRADAIRLQAFARTGPTQRRAVARAIAFRAEFVQVLKELLEKDRETPSEAEREESFEAVRDALSV
jgi:hypothetical protein